MLRSILKLALYLFLAVVIYATITGKFRAHFSWMYP